MIGQVIYTNKDKFFSLENEKRIRGRQLFSRTAVPLLILWIAFYFLGLFISILFGVSFLEDNAVLLSLLHSFLYILFSFVFFPKLIIKRCHDFNNNGILIKNLFFVLYSFFSFFVFLPYILYYKLFILSDYYMIFLSSLDNLVFLLMIIFWGFLLFKSGSKGKNIYGEDTSNVKLGTFG